MTSRSVYDEKTIDLANDKLTWRHGDMVNFDDEFQATWQVISSGMWPSFGTKKLEVASTDSIDAYHASVRNCFPFHLAGTGRVSL